MHDATYYYRCRTYRGLCVLSVRVLRTTVSFAKTAQLIEMPFGGTDPWSRVLDLDFHRKGHFWNGHVLADCNVRMHECIPPCSPAVADECACPEHAADECIRRREG